MSMHLTLHQVLAILGGVMWLGIVIVVIAWGRRR